MEGLVTTTAREYIDKFKDKNQCDFIQEFSYPFPVGIVLDLMGLPRERLQDFQHWSHQILQNDGILSVLQQGVRNSVDYLREVVAERIDNPGDDLISFAVKGEVNGRKMNEEE